MKKILPVLLASLLVPLISSAADAPHSLIMGVVQRVRENIEAERDYGYFLNVRVRKFDGSNRVTREDLRTYRTTWIEGHPYNELLFLNNKALPGDEQLNERKRRWEFIKAMHSNKRKTGSMYADLQQIRWDEMYTAYNFLLNGAQPAGLTALSFHPADPRVKDRTRFEKVIHRLEGQIWLDPEQNVVRAAARLTEPVKFGWGIFAKVEEIQIQFQQQKHFSSWAPAQLLLRFKARIALLKTERQELLVTWRDPFPRPPYLQTAESLKTVQPNSANQK